MIRKTLFPKENLGAVTRDLKEWSGGNPQGMDQAVATLLPELHRMAAEILAGERSGHTLQPTALINELYLRLKAGVPPQCNGRTHFLAIAAGTMRRILVDYARARCTQRRGGKEPWIPLEFADPGVTCTCDDLLVIEEALTRLEQADERAARVTELRFFAGLQEDEIAAELGISVITVKRDWKFARAWLAASLDSSTGDGLR